MQSTQYTGDRVLDIMSENAPNRNRNIEKLIVLNLGLDEAGKTFLILDYGAGKGEFINRLKSRKNLNLIAVDSDPEYLKKLSASCRVYNSIYDVPKDLDCIYLIDVLEHIEDDKTILKNFYGKLKIGGRLFIYVPAGKELFSSFDKSIGHFRRYSMKELKEKVTGAGFTIQKASYHELTGYFAMWFRKQFSKNNSLKASQVKFYDRFFVPVTTFIERIVPMPIGKSIYLLAIKNK